jgi:biotin carboxyl carrier protein
MEHPIRAPLDERVGAVTAQTGVMVRAGAALVELDEA